MMGPRVRAQENRGTCVDGRAAFWGPRQDRLAYRGEIRCREKIEKAWIGVAGYALASQVAVAGRRVYLGAKDGPAVKPLRQILVDQMQGDHVPGQHGRR